ncbi:PIG-X/PBN1 family protein [Sporobolomyces salmoneus]|uniref:PIG-X/PBN1 family protein n=1 Tax=Sporobolomyces salmoneus TaxID=183962 RepID=UPI003171DE0B
MSISASLSPIQGFHPTLHLSIPPLPAPSSSCSLYAFISVPPSFILDRYQLAQLHAEGRLGSQDGLVEVQREGDLEGPVWRAREAAALIQLSKDAALGTGEVQVEVPLHMRYQAPVKQRRRKEGEQGEDRVRVEMNQPRVFWACPDAPRGCPPASLSSNFSFPSLANSTLHYLDSPTSSCQPLPSTSNLSVELPAGIASHSEFVGPVTVSIVWLGFCYLVCIAVSVSRRKGTMFAVESRIGNKVEQEKKRK